MQRILVAALMSVLFLAACNNDENDNNALLNSEPYQKITDSIRNTPGDAGLYFRRGSLLYSNQQFNEAEKDLYKAWQLSPSEPYALRLSNLLKEKNPDSAIAFIRQALQKTPNSIGLSVQLARNYQQAEQTDHALAICDSILIKYPNQLDALVLKSDLLKVLDRDAESITTLEKAYSYAPNDVDLVESLAFAYAQDKNPKVLRLSDSLINADLEKRHAEPYYFKGLYYEYLGNNEEAIRYFDEATRHDFEFLDAYMDKGQVLFEMKKYADALRAFELTLKIRPSYADGYLWMAKTQEAMGNKPEAKINYQRAYGLDKTLTEAKEAADRL